MPRGDQDEMGRTYECEKCAITYTVLHGETKQCPLCFVRSELQEMKAHNLQLLQEYERLETEYERIRSHHDYVLAIRQSMELCDVLDMTFIKAVLYRWKADKGVTLQVTHTPPKVDSRNQVIKNSSAPNGWLAMYRGADAEDHKCTSVGGIAVAGYFEEAVRSMSHPHAMDAFARALNQFLTGAV